MRKYFIAIQKPAIWMALIMFWLAPGPSAADSVAETSSDGEKSNKKAPFTSLMEYIPGRLIDSRPLAILGPQIQYFNFARMRQDLGLEQPPIEMDENTKLDHLLKIGKNLQGFDISTHLAHPLSLSAFDNHGWDIRDIDHALLLPDTLTSVFEGRFNRPEIEQKLIAGGFKKRLDGAFQFYVSENQKIIAAIKSDTMIIGRNERVIKRLIDQKHHPESSAGRHPVITALSHIHKDGWGSVTASIGDQDELERRGWIMWDEVLKKNKDSQDIQKLAGLMGKSCYFWDVAMISFHKSSDLWNLVFSYYYPNPAETLKDKALLEEMMVEAPSLYHQNKKWGDLMSLKHVQADGHLLSAEATTKAQMLIGMAFSKRDYGFMPMRNNISTESCRE